VVLLIALSPFRAYAIEARSYALVTGLLAVAAATWQRVGEKRLFTLLYGVFLMLAVSCHHLAVVAIAPFAIAELARVLKTRQIRWRIWMANVAAAIPFLVSLPMLLHFAAGFSKNFWSKPTWSTALSTYSEYIGLQPTFLLALVLLLGFLTAEAVRRGWQASSASDKFQPQVQELVLLMGFLSYPALLVILTKILGSGYTPRYGWPAILGFALGVVYLFRVYTLPFVHLAVALLITFAVQTSHGLTTAARGAWITEDTRWTKLQRACHDEPAIPVVIGSGVTYLEAAHYAPADVQGRLSEVVDLDTAVRLTGADSVDRTDGLLARYIPLHVVDLASFEAAHGKFLLYSGGRYEWLTNYLTQKGYRLRLLSSEASGDFRIYLVNR